LYLRKLLYHARFINLLIVGITQSIVIFFLFDTIFGYAATNTIQQVYFLIIACTILITLGGYLINDFFDYEIDSTNKKAAKRLSKIHLLTAYFLVCFAGFGIAYFICHLIGQFSYLLVYILAMALLFLYASHFKSQGLIGNVVVALFSSLVVALLWFVQVYFGHEVPPFKASTLIFFMCFIFLASMARELVKDCEDIQGDKQFGLKTLPIRIGIERTIFFIGLFLIVLFLVLLSWFYWIAPQSSILIKASLLPIILVNLYLVFKNFKAKTKQDFASISSLIKLMMGLGIISLGLISYHS